MIRTIILVVFTITSMIEVSHVAIGASSKDTNSRDEEMLRSQVLQFLSTWLIDRDFKKAMDSFGDNAFSNAAIFDEECSGIRNEARNSAEEMKKEIEMFLESIEDFPVFNNLSDALEIEVLLPLDKKLKSKVANALVQDKFLLVRVKASDVVKLSSQKKSRESLKKYLVQTRPLYLSIIPLGGGIMYFVWEKDNQNWEIFHANLVCM